MNTIVAALVNGMLVSAALACTVRIVLRLMPRNTLNAATRYAIWWAMLAVTVGLPVLYLRPGEPDTAFAPFAPARTATSHADKVPNAPRTLRSAPSFREPSSPASPMPPPLQRVSNPVFPIAISAGPWPARILTIWLLTASLMLIRLVISALLLERRKTRATEAPPILSARVASWSLRCGGSRRIRLAVTREIVTPLVAGPWRPAILLPARLLNDLSERELEHIGIHEAAHLARGDDYALLIQRTAQALFALHPVVHWISRRIDLEREIACDDLVIATTGDPRPYAACLARVVELSGGVRAMPFTAAAVEDRSHLARRVEMLLDGTRNITTRLLAVRLALAIACIAALSWGAAQTPVFVAFAHPATATATQLPRPRLVVPVPDTIIVPILPRAPLLAQAAPPVTPPVLPAAPNSAASVADSPMVYVPVEVTDPLNRFVTGLDQEVFKIQEDGVDQVITQFAGSDKRADLFVAVGAEVNPDATLEPLLRERIQVPEAEDGVRVFGFGQLPPQLPLKALGVVKRVRDISKQCASRQCAASKRQAVLIVSSSTAGSEHYSASEMEDALRNIDVPVYVVDISESEARPALPTGQPPAASFLTELASRTGGKYIAVKSQEEVPDLLTKIVIELRNMYFLEYTPRNAARDGAYRSLQVAIRQPRGLPNLTIHSRPGYYAPTQ